MGEEQNPGPEWRADLASNPITANESGCQGEVELVMGTPACTFVESGVPRVNPGTDAEVRRGSNSADKRIVLGMRWRESWAGGMIKPLALRDGPSKVAKEALPERSS